MALTDAYHGETLGALSVSGVDLYSEIYKPIMLDIIQVLTAIAVNTGKTVKPVRLNALKMLKKFEQYGDETCAFMIEPLVQAAAGMKIYSPYT